MDLFYVVFVLLTHFVLGVLALNADRRWGVSTRRSLINVVSKEPRAIEQGFLIGRSRRQMFAWALFLSLAVNVAVIAVTSVAWHIQLTLSVPQAVACWIGMRFSPALRSVVVASGGALDKLEDLAAGRERVREAPPPRLDRIAAMEAILKGDRNVER